MSWKYQKNNQQFHALEGYAPKSLMISNTLGTSEVQCHNIRFSAIHHQSGWSEPYLRDYLS